MSVALGEMGLTYDYVKQMTWAEFRIRLFSLNRQQLNKEYELRRLCYQIYVSNWYGKTKPKSIDAFWTIKGGKSYEDRLRRMNSLMKAKQEYLKKKNG